MENKIIESVKDPIIAILESIDLRLYDIEFVNEDNAWFLRVSIEKQDGTMDFETAEKASDLISAKLDELDPISHEYILDVCSPGIEKPLKNIDDYKENLNGYISVYVDDEVYTGDLVEVNENNIVLSVKDKTRLVKKSIEFAKISKAHIAIKF